MNIQVCMYEMKSKTENYDKFHIQFSNLSEPSTFDDFDINFISLNNKTIWKNDRDNTNSINCINDFKTLKTLIDNTKKSIVIICLPQNYTFFYDVNFSNRAHYYSSSYLKDIINSLTQCLLSEIHPNFKYINLIYGRAKTKCDRTDFLSDFSIKYDKKAITLSNTSETKTTILLAENIYLTSLDINLLNENDISNFLREIKLLKDHIDIPEWLNEYDFYNDTEHKEKIAHNNLEIDRLNLEIEESKASLSNNLYFKKILIEQGQNLVDIVFEILEKILKCNLSDFIDKKEEDFLLKMESVTFIGEIKGVTSNVKSEHVSQLDVHYQSYIERIEEEKTAEKVKALLIINPLRNKPVSERMEVHEKQINLAERNGSLIITTEQLLKLYEMYLMGKCTSEKIISEFTSQIGIINLKNFEQNTNEEDLSAYKI